MPEVTRNLSDDWKVSISIIENFGYLSGTALAQKKVICIPMSRNVVREHFESGDIFFIGI